ncbi:hypothetical protein D3C80_1039980 [compost metagenome]
MPAMSTLAGFCARLSRLPMRPLSCWMAVAKLGVRLKSAKLAEPSARVTSPIWMPSGELADSGGVAGSAGAGSPGWAISRSSMLVVRSSLMMKRA